jgi:hypothetical protein
MSLVAPRFLGVVRKARTESGDTERCRAVAVALEEACTALCLGGETFVRSVDIDPTFDELAFCLELGEQDMDVLVLTCRATAGVIDMVPRAAHLVGGHRLFKGVMRTAHSIPLLHSSDALAEEAVRLASILATEARELMLEHGALALFLTYLMELPDCFRPVTLRSIAHLCGGLSPFQQQLGTHAVRVLLDESFAALGFRSAGMPNASPMLPQEPRHLTTKQRECVLCACSTLAQIIDRLCITDRDSIAVMADVGYLGLVLVNYLILHAEHLGADGTELATAAMGVLSCLFIAAPLIAITAYVQRGTIDALARGLLQTVSPTAMPLLLPQSSTEDAKSHHTRPRISALDVLQLILPRADGLDATWISLPKHRWEWEDDFRNHNAFDDSNCDTIEVEHQVQRRSRRYSPIVILHAHRPSTIHLQYMRQGNSVSVSRPIFRVPLPGCIEHSRARVECCCPADVTHSKDATNGAAAAAGSTAEGEATYTDTTEHASQRETADDGNQNSEDESSGCCARLRQRMHAQRSDGQHDEFAHREQSASNRRAQAVRGRRSRFQPTARSADVREALLLSTDLRKALAKDEATAQRLVLTLLPAALSVLRSTVDQNLVHNALILVKRLLAVVQSSTSRMLHSVVGTMHQTIARGITVVLRAAAQGAVTADLAAREAKGDPALLKQNFSWRVSRPGVLETTDGESCGYTLTRRGGIIETGSEAMMLLCRIVGAEVVLPELKSSRLETPLTALLDHLERISEEVPRPAGHSNQEPGARHRSAERAVHVQFAMLCPKHLSEAHVAASLQASVSPIAEMLGSVASSPVWNSNQSVDTILEKATSILARDTASDEDVVAQLFAISDLCAKPAALEVLPLMTELHPGFLPALARTLDAFRIRCPASIAADLARLQPLRKFLWMSCDALVAPSNSTAVIEPAPASPSEAVTQSKHVVTVRSQTELVRLQLVERISRAVVLQLGPANRGSIPPEVRDMALQCSSEVHATYSPLTPMGHICASIEKRLRPLPAASTTSSTVAATAVGGGHGHVDDDDDHDGAARAYAEPAGPVAAAAVGRNTPEPQPDEWDVYVVMPTGVVLRPNSSVKLIDALYYLHPAANGLRQFVERHISGKSQVTKPFGLWHTVVHLEYFVLPRTHAAALRASSLPIVDAGGCTANTCCSMRKLGFPICSPLHILRDAAASDPASHIVATLTAVGAIEALAGGPTAPAMLEKSRLASAVIASVRQQAFSFQGSMFTQLALDAPPLQQPSPSASRLAQYLRGGFPSAVASRTRVVPGSTSPVGPFGRSVDSDSALDAVAERSIDSALGIVMSASGLNVRECNVLNNQIPLAALTLAPMALSFELRQAILRSLAIVGSHAIFAIESERPSRSPPPVRTKVPVSRDRVAEAGHQALRDHPLPSEPVDFEFDGEIGTGPGPTNEFFALYAATFVESAELWKDATPHGARLLFPAPPPHDAEARLRRSEKYEYLGRLTARSLADGRVLSLPFHPVVWEAIVGADTCGHGAAWRLEQVDSSLHASLTALRIIADPATFEAMDLRWTLPGYDEHELKAGGADIPVLHAERGDYIDAVRRYWLGTVLGSFLESFCRGVADVFPPITLSLFSPPELDAWLRGNQGHLWPTPASFLSSIACEHGYTIESSVVQHLAHFVASLSISEQRQFLRFVSGSDCMPLKGLSPKLTIVRRDVEGQSPTSGDDSMPATPNKLPPDMSPSRLAAMQARTDCSLPTVNTCFHYLKLPPYSSASVLRDRLRYALREGQGSFQLS